MPLPTANLTGHWDASTNVEVYTTNNPGGAPSGNCTDGQDVNVWRSQVNPAHLFRAITGHGTIPVWKNDAVMNHPSVWFDKTGIDSNGGHRCKDSLGNFINPADFIAADTTQYTILIAFHPLRHSTLGRETMLTTTWWSYSAMTNYVGAGPTLAGSGYGYSGGYIARDTPDTFVLNTSHILRIRKDATTMYVSLDGGPENTIAHGNVGDLTYGGSGYYGLFLGWNEFAGSASGAFSGRIGEVAIWNVCLAGSSLTDATDYFIDKWLAAPNTSPIVNAGADQIVAYGLCATLAGSVSDDGLPSATLTQLWSVTSGPGPIIFDDDTSLTPQACPSIPGVYVLRLTASDGVLTDFDETTITFLPENLPAGDAVVGTGINPDVGLGICGATLPLPFITMRFED